MLPQFEMVTLLLGHPVYQKYLVTPIKVGCAIYSLYASSGPKAEQSEGTRIKIVWFIAIVYGTSSFIKSFNTINLIEIDLQTT